MSMILWAVIAGCFLFACVTDCRTCEVYNFTWWLSGTAAVLLMFLNGGESAKILPQLCFFCLLQLLVFSKMYGRADCYAFCVCAMAEASAGKGLFEFLLQMLLAFGVLTVVQFFRGNVDAGGKLKQPVPFLPYITLAFVMIFLFF